MRAKHTMTLKEEIASLQAECGPKRPNIESGAMKSGGRELNQPRFSRQSLETASSQAYSMNDNERGK